MWSEAKWKQQRYSYTHPSVYYTEWPLDYPSVLLRMVVWEHDCCGAEWEGRYWCEEGAIRKGHLVYMHSGLGCETKGSIQ